VALSNTTLNVMMAMVDGSIVNLMLQLVCRERRCSRG